MAGALAKAGLEAHQLFLALRRRADQHQHALAGILHAALEVDAVSLEVHVGPRRKITRLPAGVVGFPF